MSINQRLSTDQAPADGRPATILNVSDRYATKIVAVSKSGKTVTVEATRQEGYVTAGGDYDTRNIRRVFTLRKSGRWVELGQDAHHGTALLIGVAEDYRDPSF